jgi:hypothetical protein
MKTPSVSGTTTSKVKVFSALGTMRKMKGAGNAECGILQSFDGLMGLPCLKGGKGVLPVQQQSAMLIGYDEKQVLPDPLI